MSSFDSVALGILILIGFFMWLSSTTPPRHKEARNLPLPVDDPERKGQALDEMRERLESIKNLKKQLEAEVKRDPAGVATTTQTMLKR